MASGPITSRQIDGDTVETLPDFIFWAPESLQMVTAAMKLRRLLLGRKVMTNLDSILNSRDLTLPTKVHLVKAMVFPWSCMDVRVGLQGKLNAEKLMLLNCGVGEVLESPLDCKEIQPVHPKGDQSWGVGDGQGGLVCCNPWGRRE